MRVDDSCKSTNDASPFIYRLGADPQHQIAAHPLGRLGFPALGSVDLAARNSQPDRITYFVYAMDCCKMILYVSALVFIGLLCMFAI